VFARQRRVPAAVSSGCDRGNRSASEADIDDVDDVDDTEARLSRRADLATAKAVEDLDRTLGVARPGVGAEGRRDRRGANGTSTRHDPYGMELATQHGDRRRRCVQPIGMADADADGEEPFGPRRDHCEGLGRDIAAEVAHIPSRAAQQIGEQRNGQRVRLACRGTNHDGATSLTTPHEARAEPTDETSGDDARPMLGPRFVLIAGAMTSR
jgi:hypothetical protein